MPGPRGLARPNSPPASGAKVSSVQMNRLRELFRYDLARQATIAFLIGFVVIGALMIAIVASTPSFRAGTSMVGEEAAALSGEGRGRYLASVVASRDARPIGKAAAAADLAGLLESGDHDEAYDQAYEFAWNDAITQLTRRLPRQTLDREAGTQWIELLR